MALSRSLYNDTIKDIFQIIDVISINSTFLNK